MEINTQEILITFHNDNRGVFRKVRNNENDLGIMIYDLF